MGDSNTNPSSNNLSQHNSSRLRADSVNGSSVSSTSEFDNESPSNMATRRAIRNLLASDSDESNSNLGNILDDVDFEGIVGVVPPSSNTESNSIPMTGNVTGGEIVPSTLQANSGNNVVGEIINDSNQISNNNASQQNGQSEFRVYNTDLKHEDRIVIMVPVQPVPNTITNVGKKAKIMPDLPMHCQPKTRLHRLNLLQLAMQHKIFQMKYLIHCLQW